MVKFKYTIKELKRDFGKDNVTYEKIDKFIYASVDVTIKNEKKNVIQELSKFDLILSEKYKQSRAGNFDYHLKSNPQYNICLIIESESKRDFKIMIQQIDNTELWGTIVYYVSIDQSCYKLNYFDT